MLTSTAITSRCFCRCHQPLIHPLAAESGPRSHQFFKHVVCLDDIGCQMASFRSWNNLWGLALGRTTQESRQSDILLHCAVAVTAEVVFPLSPVLGTERCYNLRSRT